MIKGNWFITPHALESYLSIRRFNISEEQAFSDLVEYSQKAYLVKELENSPCVFVYKVKIGKRRCKDGKLRNIYIRFIVSKRNVGMPQLVTVMTNGLTQQNKRFNRD